MSAHKGYYGVIQYCPDRSRLEAANIGVLLFCPELSYLQARTSHDNRRIRHFFSSKGHDWNRINSFKQGLEERLEAERTTVRTLEDLERFIATRGNEFQITPPRPMKVTEPAVELAQLFDELVGGQPRRGKGASLRRTLQKKFSAAGVLSKIRERVTVNVPIFDRDIEVPFAYQNGRMHLLQPVGFEGRDVSQAINTACKYAIEGQSLYSSPDPLLGDLQLVVIGGFRSKDDDAKACVRNILQSHDVRLFATADLPELIIEIQETAKDLPEIERS